MKNRIVDDAIGYVESSLGGVYARWKQLSKAEQQKWNNYEAMLLNKLEKRKQEQLEQLFGSNTAKS